MDLPWWMYALHAFTPFFALSVTSSIKQAKSRELNNNGEKEEAPELITALLTALIVAAPFYAVWLGLHWILFKIIDIPLLYNEYFYIPISVPYLLPYVIGVGFIIYRVKFVGSISEKFTVIISSVFYGLLMLAIYMVTLTYLKWVHLCWNT